MKPSCKSPRFIRSRLNKLKRASTFTAQKKEFDLAAGSAKATAETLQAELAKEPVAMEPPAESVALPELELLLTESELRTKDIRDKLSASETAITAQSERRKSIRKRLPLAAEAKATIATRLAETAANDEPFLAQAKKLELKSQEALLAAEIPALEAELRLLDAQEASDLRRLSRDTYARNLKVAVADLTQLQAVVQERRKAKANQQTTDAKSLAEKEQDPLLHAMALHNVELAATYEEVVKSMRKNESDLNEAKKLRDHWRSQSDGAKGKVKSIGLTDAVGSMLRKQKLSLPDTRRLSHEIGERARTISDAQFLLLELEDERSADLPTTLMRSYNTELQLEDETLRKKAEDFLAKRNELLTPLIRAQSGYFDTLVDLSNTQEETQSQVDGYRDFIDERILWVRSSKPLSSKDSLGADALLALRPFHWSTLLPPLWNDLTTHVPTYTVTLLVVALLFFFRGTLLHRITSLSTLAQKRSCVSYIPTARTFIASILLALPGPIILWFLSWRMNWADGGDETSRALAIGLRSMVFIYLPLVFLRQVFRNPGLAESHFGWSQPLNTAFRRAVMTLLWCGLPLAVVTTVLSESAGAAGNDVFARLAFIALMAVFAVVAFRLLHPLKGAFSVVLAAKPNGWLNRMWMVIWAATVGIPIAFAVLCAMGYFFTVRSLTGKLGVSAGIIAAFAVGTAMLSRYLFVQRRKLSVEQARLKREAMTAEEDVALTQKIEFVSAEELYSQVRQSRRLVQFTAASIVLVLMWFLWADIFPAFGFLEKWPLWTSTAEINELIVSEAGEESYVKREVLDRVTIVDLFLATLIGIGTFVATRNLPGALELSLLKKLPIESSIRYAITAIASYLIALAGIVIAFGIVGVHWKQVQWLATALTFGLAFGLQEMFANFVAGIIILFERPIRVGDIVTVDDITGTVSKVRIRATTITNTDRKDYIVPNKDFITGRVLNWTLSDTVTRLVVSVGVAYGSDTELTLLTLKAIAKKHEQVLDEPPPQVTFEEFGDSSLNFSLRSFIAMEHMPHRLEIIHQLHMEIDAAFRRERIEIAFPQRDVHIRDLASAAPDATPSNGAHSSPQTPKSL